MMTRYERYMKDQLEKVSGTLTTDYDTLIFLQELEVNGRAILVVSSGSIHGVEEGGQTKLTFKEGD